MQALSFSDLVMSQLKDAGIIVSEIVQISPESDNFGNSEAIFRVGSLLFRFVRDRSQEFVDIGANAKPDEFHQFDDVEIAMGWKTVGQVIKRNEPEPLREALARIKLHQDDLDHALSGERFQFTRARIQKAARERGKAFISMLQR